MENGKGIRGFLTGDKHGNGAEICVVKQEWNKVRGSGEDQDSLYLTLDGNLTPEVALKIFVNKVTKTGAVSGAWERTYHLIGWKVIE